MVLSIEFRTHNIIFNYNMYERPEGIEECKIWIDGCFDFAHHGKCFSPRTVSITNI